MATTPTQDAEGVAHHLVRVSVNTGTVLLEGDQGDTSVRLAAARPRPPYQA